MNSNTDFFVVRFYSPDVSEAYSFCDDAIGVTSADDDISINDVPYPAGTIDLDFTVAGMKKCVYEGTKTEPGTLSCPDLSDSVQCDSPPQLYQSFDCNEDPEDATYVPKVQCTWG